MLCPVVIGGRDNIKEQHSINGGKYKAFMFTEVQKNAYTGWAAKPLHKAYLKKDFSHTFRFTSTLPAMVFRHTVYLEFMYL